MKMKKKLFFKVTVTMASLCVKVCMSERRLPKLHTFFHLIPNTNVIVIMNLFFLGVVNGVVRQEGLGPYFISFWQSHLNA